MGKDRQEKKEKARGNVASDRDQSLRFNGATTLEGPEEARKNQRP